MKEKIIFILIVIILIAILICSSLFIDSETKKVISSNNKLASGENAIESISSGEIALENTNLGETPSSSSETSIYLTEDEFEEKVLNSNKKILVDFYADWCPPCKMLDPILEEVLARHPEITYYKINVDKNENLASQYHIYYIPTLILFENGQKLNESTGAIPEEAVEALLQS